MHMFFSVASQVPNILFLIFNPLFVYWTCLLFTPHTCKQICLILQSDSQLCLPVLEINKVPIILLSAIYHVKKTKSKKTHLNSVSQSTFCMKLKLVIRTPDIFIVHRFKFNFKLNKSTFI